MFKIIAIIFAGASLTGWLCTANANAEISQALGNPGPDIIDTIQRWGVLLAIIGTIVGGLATKAITGYFGFRRMWDDETHKREEMLKEQQRHDSQIQDAAAKIKQINAELPAPLPSIDPPAEPPK